MEGIKVLFVDDEQELAETLAMRLETRGFQSEATFSGQEALDLLEQRDLDVIILDVVMPGKDGIETLQDIKSRKPLIEVIMLSGHANMEIAIQGMQNGAFDFLVKPPDMGDLVEKINKAYKHKIEQEERIRKAGFVREQLAEPISREAAESAEFPKTTQGTLLVIGRESDFSSELIQYALDISKRMSYEILAMNAAGFDNESFRLFPAARERVCEEFKEISEKNAALFKQAAGKEGIPFKNVVMLCDQDDAITQIRKEIGDIDYVVCECEEDSDQPKGQIVAYTPI
jgi:DNA-binding response OmpR family regulator